MNKIKLVTISFCTSICIVSLMGCGSSAKKSTQEIGSASNQLPANAPEILSFTGISADENIGVTDALGNAQVVQWNMAKAGRFTYDCRFSSPSLIDSATLAPCDGSNGNQARFTIPSDAQNGQKILEVIAIGESGLSTSKRIQFYIHSELNQKEACNTSFNLDVAFANASNALGITLLSPSFGSQTALSHPNKIVHLGNDTTFQIETLRRQLYLSSDNKLIAVVRKYVRDNGSCKNGFTIGHHNSITRGEYERANFDCAAYVFSADGRAAVCLDNNGQIQRRSTDALKPLLHALTHENNGYDL